MICKYAEIFCWKNVSGFCSAKATHIFSAKNIRILYIESAETVNEMTLNELVKLTTLWTTRPCTSGQFDEALLGHFVDSQRSNASISKLIRVFVGCMSKGAFSKVLLIAFTRTSLSGSVWCGSNCWSGCGFDPLREYSFVEIDPEILSAVTLSLPLIQEGQLSVSGERICTSTG